MNYTKTSGYYKSSDHKTNLAYFIYKPLQQINGVLQISHGMCEYIERYEDFANYLTGKGILVCGNDHLGHGKSTTNLNELGYFGEENGWTHLYNDLHQLTLIIKKRYPTLPYFLLGHSMGSFVARAYLSKFAKDITAAIIVGTAGANPMLNGGLLLTKLLKTFRGEKFRSKLIYKIAFANYNKKCPQPINEYAWLSQDPQVCLDYAQNPYNNFIFTTQGFHDLFSLLKFVSQPIWPPTLPKNLPMFLVSGEMDPVGNYGTGVTQVYNNLLEAKLEQVELKLYPNLRHEIINEIGKEQVYADIFNWLNKFI